TGLAALFLLGMWQVTPLPRDLMATVSPRTAELREQLLPAEPEEFPGGEGDAIKFPDPTISLYPEASKRVVVQVLAVLVVFVAVLNNCATVATLQRLSIVAVVNGALLAVFALVQFFTSPSDTLYWTYPSLGQVFGPFICRTHYCFYVNMCLALGLGLLM